MKHTLRLLILVFFVMGIQIHKSEAQTAWPFSPTNASSTIDTFATLKWGTFQGVISFNLQFSSFSDFSSLIIDTTALTVTNFSVNQLSRNRTYYWRVKAFTAIDSTDWSPASSFTVFRPQDLDTNLYFYYPIERGTVNVLAANKVNFCYDLARFKALRNTTASTQPVFVDSIRILNYTSVINHSINSNLRNDSILDSLGCIFFVVDSFRLTPNHFASWTNSTVASWGWGDINTQLSGERISFVGTGGGPDASYSDTSLINSNYNIICFNFNEDLQEYEMYLNGFPIVEKYFVNNRVNRKKKIKLNYFNIGARIWTNSYFRGNIAEVVGMRNGLDSLSVHKMHNYLFSKMAPRPNLGPDKFANYGLCNTTILNPGNHFVRTIWSTGDSTPSITASLPGNYWVRTTDGFGRTLTDTFRIVLKDTLYTLPDTTICLFDSIVWNTRMPNSYFFLWNTGSTDSFLVIKDPGAYYVRLSDSAGCFIYTDTVIVSVDSFSLKNEIGPDTNFCAGNRLYALQIDPSTRSLLWSTGDTSRSLAIFSSGSYDLTLTNIRSCVARDTIFVGIRGIAPFPNIEIQNACLGNPPLIRDSSIAFSPEFISKWTWDLGDGTIDSVFNPVHVYDSTGVFTISLIVTTDSGCTSSTSETVEVYPLPTANFNPVISCAGGFTKLNDNSTAPAGNTLIAWKWKVGTDSFYVRNLNYKFDSIGKYPVTLTVTHDGNCSDSYSDSLLIFPAIKPNFQMDGACEGLRSTFYDSSPTTSIIERTWNINSGALYVFRDSASYTFPSSGTYPVTLYVKNSIGCSDSIQKNITIYKNPEILSIDSVQCYDKPFSITANATVLGDTIVSYWWSSDSIGNYSGKTPSISLPIQITSGIFPTNLSVKTSHNCVDSADVALTFRFVVLGELIASTSYGDIPLNVNFSVRPVYGTFDYSSFIWVFGDGDSSRLSNPSHTYTDYPVGKDYYLARVFFKDIYGCDADYWYPYERKKEIYVLKLETDLQIDNVSYKLQNINSTQSYLTPLVSISNVGTSILTNADFIINFNGQNAIAENRKFNILRGESTVIELATRFLVDATTELSSLCVEAINVNAGKDSNLFNNSDCAVLDTDQYIIGNPYPVPSNGVINVDMIFKENTDIKITVHNLLGHRLLNEFYITPSSGLYTHSFETGTFLPGVLS